MHFRKSLKKLLFLLPLFELLHIIFHVCSGSLEIWCQNQRRQTFPRLGNKHQRTTNCFCNGFVRELSDINSLIFKCCKGYNRFDRFGNKLWTSNAIEDPHTHALSLVTKFAIKAQQSSCIGKYFLCVTRWRTTSEFYYCDHECHGSTWEKSFKEISSVFFMQQWERGNKKCWSIKHWSNGDLSMLAQIVAVLFDVVKSKEDHTRMREVTREKKIKNERKKPIRVPINRSTYIEKAWNLTRNALGNITRLLSKSNSMTSSLSRKNNQRDSAQTIMKWMFTALPPHFNFCSERKEKKQFLYEAARSVIQKLLRSKE